MMRAIPGMLAGLAALVLTLSITGASAAPDAAAQAVQAYIGQQQALADKARDQLVVNQTPQLIGGSPVVGNPHGDVTVVEFFDYACPYCKAVEPRLEAFLKADKKARLVIKEFPILTPASMVAAKAALAAAKQGKYKGFHDALMAYQGALENDAIFDTAKSQGLDLTRLRKDMDAPEITNEIITNFNLARGLRLFQTPSFVFAGHILTGASADIDFPKLAAAARGR